MKMRSFNLGRALHVKHGFAFKGEYFASEGEFVVLTPGNFYEGGGFRARPGKDRFYSGDIPDGFVLDEDDLVVAMTEQGPGLLGSSALIPDGGVYLHNQRIGRVTIEDEDLLDREFAYYLFNSRAVRAQIAGSATGTKVRHTAPERIYRVEVSVPEVEAQRRAATLLRRYDKLIANALARIGLLEAGANAVFQEWIQRFGHPSQAGVSPAELSAAGWRKRKISSLTSFISRGITPKYDDEALGVVISQKCIRDGKLSLVPARRQSKKIPQSKLVLRGDVLVNSTGEGTLGRVAQAHEDIEFCTVDSHVTIVRPNVDEVYPVYFGAALSRLEAYFMSQGRGATNQKELAKSIIEELEILVPPMDIQEDFDRVVGPMKSQIVVLSRLAAKAAAARDLLAPSLLDGTVAA